MSLTLSQRFFQHQKKTAILVGAILAFIGALIAFCNRPSPAPVKDTLHAKKPLYDVTQAVEDKSLWMFKSENRLAEQEKTQAFLLKEIETLKSTLAKYEAEPQNAPGAFSPSPSSERTPTNADGSNVSNAHPSSYFTGASQYEASETNLNAPDALAREREPALPPAVTIFSDTLSLTTSTRHKSTPHINRYIPAGSYAKAVLLSGVDVSAGVSSQATPKPVLLRLVHPGSLPNQAIGNLKDCRIIAAAYGDLSSERAYLRLEKLSCTESDGHVIEHNVDGYISGEDGKNGIRGRVVMRDSEVLQRGFMGGLLSGLGKAVGKSFSATSVSPFGAVKTSNAKGADFLAEASAEGAGDAFELMAKYNIQRAEQYQPVIQISAGRTVDVVFHSGSPFGEQTPKTELPKPPVYQPPS